jgi:hypothetical protein
MDTAFPETLVKVTAAHGHMSSIMQTLAATATALRARRQKKTPPRGRPCDI